MMPRMACAAPVSPFDVDLVDVGPVNVGERLSENGVQIDFPSGFTAPNNVLNGHESALSDSMTMTLVPRKPLTSPLGSVPSTPTGGGMNGRI